MSRVRSLERGMAILELLAHQPRGLNMTEIAQSVGLPYATAYRLVQTLCDLGYLDFDPKGSVYTLSLRVLRWQGAVLQRLSIPRIAYGPMLELMETFQETVHLAVLDDGEVVYLETVIGSRSLSMYTQTGKRAPAHCTALGKVLLAYRSPREVQAIVERRGLTRFTPNTIGELDQLMEELERIRRQCFAIDNEEMELGVRCVASYVVNHEGRVVAAISLSAPASRIQDHGIDEIAEAVVQTCKTVSRDLGAPDAIDGGLLYGA